MFFKCHDVTLLAPYILERKRIRERALPSVGSLSKGPQWMGWVTFKTRNWELNPDLPHSWLEPHYLSHHYRLPVFICMELESGVRLGNRTQALQWGMWAA